MPTVLITGGTGMIGKALTGLLLQKGYKVIVLTRALPSNKPAAGLSYAIWNVSKQTIDIDAVQKADYIVHLSGAGVADKRWTNKRKKEIVISRTQSSALLVNTLKENNNRVKAVISASAIGWYGADPIIPNPHPFTEPGAAGTEFLSETCRLWENSIQPVIQLDKRLVIIRTGIVLSTAGGALKEFIKPLRFGIAAILGNGRQMVSWIHIDDMCRIYAEAIENDSLRGVYNAVAPKPVSSGALTIMLAKAIREKFYIAIHIPAFILKLMLGKMSIEVLQSCTVSAEKIRQTGFIFLYPSIEAALNTLRKRAL